MFFSALNFPGGSCFRPAIHMHNKFQQENREGDVPGTGVSQYIQF
jgi:hypothetical protein